MNIFGPSLVPTTLSLTELAEEMVTPASTAANKQPSRCYRGGLAIFLAFLKQAESHICLPAYPFPVNLRIKITIIIIADIIQVSHSYHITGAQKKSAQVQLNASHEGKISLPECIFGGARQMLVLLQQNAVLRSRLYTKKTKFRNGLEAQ